jgi:hypothetical protein
LNVNRRWIGNDTASYVTIRSPWKPGEEPFSSIMSQQANVSPPNRRKTELQKPASKHNAYSDTLTDDDHGDHPFSWWSRKEWG